MVLYVGETAFVADCEFPSSLEFNRRLRLGLIGSLNLSPQYKFETLDFSDEQIIDPFEFGVLIRENYDEIKKMFSDALRGNVVKHSFDYMDILHLPDYIPRVSRTTRQIPTGNGNKLEEVSGLVYWAPINNVSMDRLFRGMAGVDQAKKTDKKGIC